MSIPDKPITNFGVNMTDEQTGKQFTLIPQSGNTKSYFVSFRKMLENLGIVEEEFIQFNPNILTAEGKQIVKQRFDATKDYLSCIEGNYFYQKRVLSNFHESLIYSNVLKTPMMLDGLHNDLLKALNRNIVKVADVRLDILKKVNDLLCFTLPDLTSKPIDDILVLRKDRLFRQFRNKLLDINKTITETPAEKLEEQKIESLFIRDLIIEMKELSPNGKDLLINGILGSIGLIPPLGAVTSTISFGKEIKESFEFEFSWLAFIIKNMN